MPKEDIRPTGDINKNTKSSKLDSMFLLKTGQNLVEKLVFQIKLVSGVPRGSSDHRATTKKKIIFTFY